MEKPMSQDELNLGLLTSTFRCSSFPDREACVWQDAHCSFHFFHTQLCLPTTLDV